MWEGRGRSRLSSSSPSPQPLAPLRSAYTDVRDATLSAQRAGQISHREAAGSGESSRSCLPAERRSPIAMVCVVCCVCACVSRSHAAWAASDNNWHALLLIRGLFTFADAPQLMESSGSKSHSAPCCSSCQSNECVIDAGQG